MPATARRRDRGPRRRTGQYVEQADRAQRSRRGQSRRRSAGIATGPAVADGREPGVRGVRGSGPRGACGRRCAGRTSGSAALRSVGSGDPFFAGRPFSKLFQDVDGLPHNTIHALLVDRAGSLWVGTQDGAAAYDGRAWKQVGLPHPERSNFVRSMLETRDGSIWIGRQAGGLSRLQDGKWLDPDFGTTGLQQQRVNALLETSGSDGSTVLWVGTADNGLQRFDGRNWTGFGPVAGLPSAEVWSLVETGGSEGPSFGSARARGRRPCAFPTAGSKFPRARRGLGKQSHNDSFSDGCAVGLGRYLRWWPAALECRRLDPTGTGRGPPEPLHHRSCREPIGRAGGVLDRHRRRWRRAIRWRTYPHGGARRAARLSRRLQDPGDARGPGSASGLVGHPKQRADPHDRGALEGLSALPGNAERPGDRDPAPARTRWVDLALARNRRLRCRGLAGGGLAAHRAPVRGRSATTPFWRWPSPEPSAIAGWCGSDPATVACRVSTASAGGDSTRRGSAAGRSGAGGARNRRRRRGTLWVGTRNGLAEFDGTRWRQAGDEPGSPAGSILSLVGSQNRDGEPELWVGTTNGLFRHVGGSWRNWDDRTGCRTAPSSRCTRASARTASGRSGSAPTAVGRCSSGWTTPAQRRHAVRSRLHSPQRLDLLDTRGPRPADLPVHEWRGHAADADRNRGYPREEFTHRTRTAAQSGQPRRRSGGRSRPALGRNHRRCRRLRPRRRNSATIARSGFA